MARLEKHALGPVLPDGLSVMDEFKAEDEWLAREQQAGLELYEATGSLVGCVWRHPVGDGFAWYQVTSEDPFTVALVLIGDCYQIPDAHIRGLEPADVERHVRMELAWQRKEWDRV